MPSEPASRRARLRLGLEQRRAGCSRRCSGASAGSRRRCGSRSARGSPASAAGQPAAPPGPRMPLARSSPAQRPEVTAVSPPASTAGHAEHLVFGLAVDDRARARRVVADHAADGRLVDRRGVRPELEAVGRGGAVERRLHDARLHASAARLRVDARGCGRAGSSRRRCRGRWPARPCSWRRRARRAARRTRRATAAGGRSSTDAGDQHRVGHDAVDRGVGGVQPARERGGAHLARHPAAQRLGGGAPGGRRLGDAAALSHAAKDTPQSPPGLNAGSQRLIWSSTPAIMRTPKTTRSTPAPICTPR